MTAPPTVFRLTDSALAALGAGRPDAATLATLRRAQLSRHLLLLREVRRAQHRTPAWYADLTAADHDEARRRITDPMTGLWAAHTLRSADAATGAAGPQPGGHSLRARHADLILAVRVDDADPLRRLLGLAPSEPLTAAEIRHWQNCLDEAWRILVSRHRAAAETVAAVLRVIVPVRPDPAAEGISATSAEAFGAVAMSEPGDATALAVGLLHEVQHSVLNAVHQLFELVPPSAGRGYSPWRDDPRPAFGVLHGAYAYLAVTRFWRVEASAAGRFEFARWRVAVAETAERLLAGGELTAAGTRFVTALRDEVRPWRDEPVEPATERLAGLARADHHVRWRLANLVVAPDDVAALARAWQNGQPPPRVRSGLVTAPGRAGESRALENSSRARLARALAKGEPATRPGGGASPADVACLRGDDGTAAHAYHKDLEVDRGNDGAWAGLALVSPRPALRRRPEVVRALALAAPGATIDELADWLAG